MKVGGDLGAYLACRVLADDGQREGQPQIVQLPVRKAATPGRPNSALGKVELVSFTYSPGIEHRLGQQDAKGISDTPYADFHA